MNNIEKLQKDLVYCNTSKDKKTIYVAGLDTRGILSHIVGIISLQGLTIKKAFSNFEEYKGKLYFEEYKGKLYFENTFFIDYDDTKKESWFVDLPELIEQQTKLVYEKKHQESQRKIVNNFVDFLSRKKNKKKRSPVINIEIYDKEKFLETIIQGEDMPFLLYMISLAIEQQRLSIKNFEINTQKNFVEDVFFLEKPNNFDKDGINRLRLYLILNIQFGFLLDKSPDPYQAFLYFQEMLSNLIKENISNTLEFFISQNQQKDSLATLLGSGDYLWQDFIRTNSNEVIKMLSNANQDKEEKQIFFEKELKELLLQEKDYEKKVDILNKYKDEKIFTIDIKNILHKNQDIKSFSIKVSELAKATIRQATVIVETKLLSLYGQPESSVGQISDWALFALGKLGGSALGYASDIELMFIYEDSGKTNGAEKISNREYFELFIQEIKTIIKAPREGSFKIDLRLRPYGDAGPLAVRLHNFMDYYSSSQVHSIELLALTRMRPIAGEPRLAERVLRIIRSILYQPNSIDVGKIFDMRKKQIREKIKPNTRNAKFGLGALVDVEYSVQILQLQYGKDIFGLQQPSIHCALQTLYTIGEISEEDSKFLTDAYIFFRRLINALRVRRGNAKDVTLPEENTWELEHLARRVGYISDDEQSAGEKLIFDFDSYSVGVINFTKKLFGKASEGIQEQTTNPGQIVYLEDINEAKNLLRFFQNSTQAFKSIKNCYKDEESQRLFSQLLLLMWVRIIRRGDTDLVVLTFERVVEKLNVEETKKLYRNLLKQPKSLSVLVDIFVTSRFLSEEIVKNPQYIFDFLKLKNIRQEKFIEEYKENLESLFFERNPVNVLEERNLLREFRKKETLRIMIRDVCIQAPLQHICSEISCLAQTLIQKSLEISCKRKNVSSKGIVVLAFGKLGSHELNYSSDLDLLVVYDDSCKLSLQEITSITKITVRNLTEYTSAGIAYRIDLRLRPFGESGDIVTSIKSFLDYYIRHARLWEIQAGLKLSCVGGDESLGKICYQQFTEISKKRLEKMTEQEIKMQIHSLRKKSVSTHIKVTEDELYEIKNSWGGIRDIEFSVQALLLIYYDKNIYREKLTTIKALQELVDKKIISEEIKNEMTTHYLFLRKVEHFLQVYEDKQLHAIPQKDGKVTKRLAWLLMQEQDEDVFINKLQKTKEDVHCWYKSIFLGM